MNTREKNILNTLHLLSIISFEQKFLYKDGEPQRDILLIKEKHLKDSGLTKAVFINALKLLAERGYVIPVPIFGDTFDADIKIVNKDKDVLSKIEELDSSLPDKVKDSIHLLARSTIPASIVYEKEDIENPTMQYIFTEAHKLLENAPKGTFAFILLNPSKDIDWLLNKIESGEEFEHIQDPGLHYDSVSYKLYFNDGKFIETSYNNKPNKEHFALQALFTDRKETEIDYFDIPEFDHSRNREKEKKSFRDALNRFLKKHPELPKIFTVHTDHLSLNEDYK